MGGWRRFGRNRRLAWVRRQRGAPGAGVQLPARRQGQFRGGPRGGSADDRGRGQSAGGRAANRAFLGRAVRFLAEEAGLRQFLDIGTGLPTEGNTHEVAQAIAPRSRIVYVDNDPIVLSHATALLKSAPGGACQYVQADIREPGKILAEAARTLDFSQPVAVMILMTLQYVPDADDPHQIVRTLMDAMPPGSYLAISDVARDLAADANVEASTERLNKRLGPVRQTIRSPEEIGRFFDGLELTEPGLVQLPQWRPDLGYTGPVEGITLSAYCGVARKP